MTKPRTDTKANSDTAGEENEETQSESKRDEEKSSSTDSTSTNEEGNKYCMNAVDFLTRKAKGFAIEKAKMSETVTGKSSRKASAAVIKRRKRTRGGIKSSISLVSGLNEIGLDFDSELEPTNAADDVLIKEQKGKGKEQQEADAFQGSDTDPEEECKRMKNEKNNHDDDDDDTHDKDGAGSGLGAQKNLSSLGLEVA